MESSRSPTAVTLSVWRALFLREAVNRLSRERAAWFWLLVEPVVHVAFLLLLFMTVRARVIGGIDTAVWLMIGITAFFMFRRTAQQAMNAVGANQSLFTYRQVKPVDPVLVRAGLEGFLMILITVVLFTGAGLYGIEVTPADPLAVLGVLCGMWLFGTGFGLITSVAIELLPQVGRFLHMVMQPLYFLSGVIFPIAQLPPPYRGWLMFNPLAHGLEAARLGFAPYYQAAPETSIAYLYGCALVVIFSGLLSTIVFGTTRRAMIIVEDVHKRYQTPHGPGSWVLRGVNLTIPTKISVGLIGRNGAGKSTLLRLIGGIDQPTRGRIERRCRVSWPIGRAGGLAGALTGRQNARFVCRIHGQESDIPDRLAQIQDFAELGEAFDQPIGTYSSGMRSRLQFAISLAFDFDVYIADESIGAGDRAFRRKAKAAFEERAGRASLVLVSHGEAALRQFCTAGIFLNAGKAHWFDDLEDALTAYEESLP